MNTRIIYSILLLSLIQCMAFSQVDTLPVEKVEVLKAFDAKIIDVEALSFQPEAPVIQHNPFDFQYNVQVKALDLSYPPPLIRPIAMKPDEKKKDYNGGLKLALGTQSSKFGELYYQYKIDRYYDISLSLDHLSAEDPDIFNKKASNTAGRLDIGYYINDKWKASLSGGYSHQRNYFYAFQDLEGFPFDSTARRDRKLLDLSLGFGNGAEENINKHIKAGLDFYNLGFGDEDASEQGIDFSLDGQAWLSEALLFDFVFGTKFVFSDPSPDNYHIFYFNPALKFSPRKWKIKLGADILRSSAETVILPDARFQLTIIDQQLNLFGGASGDYFLNSLKRQSAWNPFFSENQDSLRFTKELQFYLGANGMTDVFNFELRGGYKIIDNQLLYLNDTIAPRKFVPVWDDLSSIFLEFSAFIDLSKHISLEPSVEFNLYETDLEEEPWHLPSYQLGLAARITSFDGKFYFRPQLISSNPVKYRTLEGETEELNAQIDLSLEASYMFHEYIGLYFRAHNLFNNKHEAFYGYDGFGTQILGGIKAKF